MAGMRGYMFRNRWGALFFVGLTLAGVTTLVGTEKEGGALQEATHQLARQKAQAEELAADPASATETGKPLKTVVIPADEELIDQALGEDPTPIDEFAEADRNKESPADGDQVIIVSREVAGAGLTVPPEPAPQQ